MKMVRGKFTWKINLECTRLTKEEELKALEEAYKREVDDFCSDGEGK